MSFAFRLFASNGLRKLFCDFEGGGLQELRRNLYVFVKLVVLVLVTREYDEILGTIIISVVFWLFIQIVIQSSNLNQLLVNCCHALW